MAAKRIKVPDLDEVNQTQLNPATDAMTRWKQNKDSVSSPSSSSEAVNVPTTSSRPLPKGNPTEPSSKPAPISTRALPITTSTNQVMGRSATSTAVPSSSSSIQPTSSTGAAYAVGGVPVAVAGGNRNTVIVSSRQRGNPVLKFVRNVIWEFGDIQPDYLLGVNIIGVFLSLKFHRLKPNYIHERFKLVGRRYGMQLLLVQVDLEEPGNILRELNKICLLADYTMILSWSPEEVARYIEIYKIYENKPPDIIMGNLDRLGTKELLVEVLTSVRIVNKTDAEMLLTTFGSLKAVTEATEEELQYLPGFGPLKAKKLFQFFREPWKL